MTIKDSKLLKPKKAIGITEQETQMLSDLVDQICALLDERSYANTKEAIMNICLLWYSRKKSLIKILCGHPSWNHEKFRIEFMTEFERGIDLQVLEGFLHWCRDSLSSYSTITKDIERLYHLFGNKSLFSTVLMTELSAQIINDAFPGIKAVAGQKTSRVLNKLCTQDFTKFALNSNYARKFNRCSDAISPVSLPRRIAISVNPIDYLLMSNGNGWSSCHDIRTIENQGEYASGSMSYMLDDCSVVFYAINPDYTENLMELQSKVMRQMFAYNHEVLLQSRMYPSGNDVGAEQLYEKACSILQEVFATGTGNPNVWSKSPLNNSICSLITSNQSSRAYPDWTYSKHFNRCSIAQLESNTADLDKKAFSIGAAPICIYCGKQHGTHGLLCSKCQSDCYKHCAGCGRKILNNNFIEYEGRVYCSDCTSTCNDCDTIKPNDNFSRLYTDHNNYRMVCSECYSRIIHYGCCTCGRSYENRDELAELADKSDIMLICHHCIDRGEYKPCNVCGKILYNNNNSMCKACYEQKRLTNSGHPLPEYNTLGNKKTIKYNSNGVGVGGVYRTITNNNGTSASTISSTNITATTTSTSN